MVALLKVYGTVYGIFHFLAKKEGRCVLSDFEIRRSSFR
jgi:hypothetical protein